MGSTDHDVSNRTEYFSCIFIVSFHLRPLSKNAGSQAQQEPSLWFIHPLTDSTKRGCAKCGVGHRGQARRTRSPPLWRLWGLQKGKTILAHSSFHLTLPLSLSLSFFAGALRFSSPIVLTQKYDLGDL